jgi:lactoylglutathione lyase
VRTLHFGLRVADLPRAVEFYTALGYAVVGSVPETPLGGLTMLLTAWLTDPDGNRIELVQWPAGHAGGLSAADWSA